MKLITFALPARLSTAVNWISGLFKSKYDSHLFNVDSCVWHRHFNHNRKSNSYSDEIHSNVWLFFWKISTCQMFGLFFPKSVRACVHQMEWGIFQVSLIYVEIASNFNGNWSHSIKIWIYLKIKFCEIHHTKKRMSVMVRM